jgi:hypothetical protein
MTRLPSDDPADLALISVGFSRLDPVPPVGDGGRTRSFGRQQGEASRIAKS